MFRRLAIILITLAWSGLAHAEPEGAQHESSVDGVVVHLQNDDVLVTPIHQMRLQGNANQKHGSAIAIWSRGTDQFVSSWKEWGSHTKSANNFRLISASRSSSGDSALGVSSFTTQLDQLSGLTLIRGKSLLTPYPGSQTLSGQVTFRRRPFGDGQTFPATAYRLRRVGDRKTLVTISFANGQSIVHWAEIKNLADSLRDGLPPGEYVVQREDGQEAISFLVLGQDFRKHYDHSFQRLLELCGDQENTLYDLLRIEQLMSQTDGHGKRVPLLMDTLNLIDAIPSKKRTDYLGQLYGKLLKDLTYDQDLVGNQTRTDPIEEARQRILRGQWRAGRQILLSVDSDSSVEQQGLKWLYLAVIQAESGEKAGRSTRQLFEKACQVLRNGSPANQFRAHNNFAAFLLNRSVDRLHNHAFQVAAGARSPLIRALQEWSSAQKHYLTALQIADSLDKAQKAAVLVNLARAYSVMADMIQTVSVNATEENEVTKLIAVAMSKGIDHANAALTIAPADSSTRGAAHEVLAGIAYRHADYRECNKQSSQALNGYVDAGSLAGVESISRLQGLLQLRLAGQSPNDGGSWSAAERWFMLSQWVSEELRRRYPGDESGATRAGFFARRAYVTEKLIEVLIHQKRYPEALIVADRSKAESLNQVLQARQIETEFDHEELSLTHLLENWPADTCAVEYFLGSRRSWVFFVDQHGDVSAELLRNVDGSLLESQTFVQGVSKVLNEIDGYGPKAGTRLAIALTNNRTPKFDHAWQFEFYDLFQILFPTSIWQQIQEAKHLAVIPHHVLHYFPYAALVTQLDPNQNRAQMPQPQFVVDEPFDMFYVPSLSSWQTLHDLSSRPLKQVNAVGVADFLNNARYLNGVNTELANLKEVFGDQLKTVLVDEQVSRDNILELLKRPGILSIATHGEKQPDNPLEGFLYCRNGTEDIAKLTTLDIYCADVNSDLILLNACYGGFADRSPLPGDDLFGLQRAFIRAGARTVISGLWDIHDAIAPEIMHAFYHSILSGRPAPTALADAQRAHLKKWRSSSSEVSRFFSHPYFWAVFTVFGDNRTGGKIQ